MYDKDNLIVILKKAIPFLLKEDAEKFLSICEFKQLKNKEIIVRENTKSRKAFFIIKGTLRSYLVNDKGIEKNIFLRPRHTVMASPNGIFENNPAKYTIETIGNSELLVFNFKSFEELAFKNANILKFYIFAFKEIIQTMVYRVESMINRMPEQRYEDLLQKSPQFFKTVYHKDIASYLGITPVSLSRIRKRKEKK